MKNYLPQKEVMYFISFYFTGIIFFEFFRAMFLLNNFHSADGVPVCVLLQSFFVGWRFDTVITCYIITPFFLLGNLPLLEPVRFRTFRSILFILTTAVFGFAYFLCLADIEFFKEFNCRLNYYAFAWVDTPGFIIRMIWEMYPVIRYLVLFAVIMVVFTLLNYKILKKVERLKYRPVIVLRILYFFIFGFLIFLGIRGRIQHKSPIRWGNAYFSNYNFANQMALNPVFTFGNAIIENIESQKESAHLSNFYSISDASRHTEKLLKQPLVRNMVFSEKNPVKYNVVLVLMENFASSFIGAQRAEIDLTPNFNKLCEKGVLFVNFFSNGLHTYTGLFSSITGLPNPPGKSIMKRTMGQQKFSGLGTILKNEGYETLFFCTHDPVFDNMAGFLKNNGFDRIIAEADYDKKFVLSTLGVSDHIMFERAVNELSGITNKPFFALILTASNHGPWILPNVDFDRVNPNLQEAEKYNAFKYSDWALNRFIELSRKLDYFKKTIFVITADHGSLYKPKYDLDISGFHIPLLIYAPYIIGDKSRRIHTFGGQTDIPSTIMGMLKMDYKNRTLGRDILTLKETDGFAQFREGLLSGFINNKFYLIDRLKASASLYEYKSDNPTQDLSLLKKEVLQKMQTDLRAYIQTGEYIINKPRTSVRSERKGYKNEDTAHY